MGSAKDWATARTRLVLVIPGLYMAQLYIARAQDNTAMRRTGKYRFLFFLSLSRGHTLFSDASPLCVVATLKFYFLMQ